MSQETGRYYLTARQASVTSTFTEETCKGLIGTKLPGKISKIEAEEYSYPVPETGEILTLHHRWVYNPQDSEAIEEVVYEKELANGQFAF